MALSRSDEELINQLLVDLPAGGSGYCFLGGSSRALSVGNVLDAYWPGAVAPFDSARN
jgi:hypothetical protein